MLSYAVTGPPDAPPLLFLHGFLGCKEDWEATLEGLKDHFRCYTFDLPGHGGSPIDGEVHTTLATLHLETAPLVGYSMGGRIALSLKTTSPLILIAAHPGLKRQGEKENRWESDLRWCEKLTALPFESFLHEWYAQPLFASIRRQKGVFLEMLERRSSQNPLLLAQVLLRFSLAKQERQNSFPSSTLYLYGTEDLKFGTLSLTLPKSVSVQSIKGTGHVIPLENPQELAQRIVFFLHRHSLL